MSQSGHGSNVLILAASGRIVPALARQLAMLGYGLSLDAHCSERLDVLATELKSHPPPIFHRVRHRFHMGEQDLG